jgi:hypothetical protein
MLPDTLKALSAHPPPKFSNLRFQKHAAAYAEIERLETLLGVSHSQPPNNIVAANARVSQLTELLEAKVAAPAVPAASPEAFPGAAIIQALDSINHPADKVEFYRANKAEVDRAYRDAPPPKAAHKPTGSALVDQMNALDDPRARVAFYRKNKISIDAIFETLNL